MKKVLSITLILIIFATFTTNIIARSPPPQIIIRSDEELVEMRKMVNADAEELQNYLKRTSHSENGLRTREDFISFLELLDSLPVPYTSEMRLEYLNYSSQSFTIFIGNGRGFHLQFRYHLSGNIDMSTYKIYHVLDIGNHVTIYRRPNFDSFPTESGVFFLPMKVDEYIVTFVHRPINEIVFSEDFYEYTITLFEELGLWVNTTIIAGALPVLAIEDEPEPLTTEDALIILQAAMGLIELCDEDIARFEIDGKPETADALRILRLVVGLS